MKGDIYMDIRDQLDSVRRRPTDIQKQKEIQNQKTQKQLVEQTKLRYSETEQHLQVLRQKIILLEKEIQNLERKQQNRIEFLKSSEDLK